MSIKGDVQELESIRAEIKTLNIRRKKLKEKEKIVVGRISEYLKTKDTPGVKHQGVAVILEEKETSGPKKPKDRDMDAMLVLERYGIKDTQQALADIMAARKGEKIVKPKLKVQKYKGT